MNEMDVRATVEYTQRMFPASDWTAEITTLFIDRLRRIEITDEQAKAVVGEYRMGYRGKTPDAGTLIRRMREVEAKPRPTPRLAVDGIDTGRAPVTGYERELVRRFRENRDDPIFARLKDKHARCGTTEAFRARWREIAGA